MGVFILALAAASAAPPTAVPANQSDNASDQKVVCRLITEAGSRIPFRVCRTAGEWEQMAKKNQDDWTSSRNSRVVGCNRIDCT